MSEETEGAEPGPEVAAAGTNPAAAWAFADASRVERNKSAPNWDHLRLKWGEALNYAGKRDEAQKQFTRAAALDLTPSEQSELAHWVPAHA